MKLNKNLTTYLCYMEVMCVHLILCTLKSPKWACRKVTCNTTSLSVSQTHPHFIKDSARTRREDNLLPEVGLDWKREYKHSREAEEHLKASYWNNFKEQFHLLQNFDGKSCERLDPSKASHLVCVRGVGGLHFVI